MTPTRPTSRPRREPAMRDIDFFNFFRYSLATVVGIYATVVTMQSLYGWYVYLSGAG